MFKRKESNVEDIFYNLESKKCELDSISEVKDYLIG